MEKIFLIIKRDIKRLGKNVIALVIVMGVCAIPSLYAWFNIAANWDPYGSTNGIKVAVASEDVGANIENFNMNIGDEIINNLRENKQIGWQFVDSNKAMEGVKSGEYYATVIIPKEFSQDMLSITSGKIKRPKIQYYVNEKKNAIAPKITDKGVNSINQQINDTFIEVSTEAVTTALNKVLGNSEDATYEALNSFILNMEELNGDLDIYSNNLRLVADSLNALNGVVGVTKDTMPQVQVVADDMNSVFKNTEKTLIVTKNAYLAGINNVNSLLDSTYNSCDEVIKNAEKLKTDISSAQTVLEEMEVTTEQAQGTANSAEGILNNVTNNTTKNSAEVKSVSNQIAASETSIAQMERMIETLRQTLISTGQISTAELDRLIVQANNVKTSIRKAQKEYNESLRPMLQESYKSINNLNNSLIDLTKDGSKAVANSTVLLDSVSVALQSGEAALDSTTKSIGVMKEKNGKAIDKANEVKQSERLANLSDAIKEDPRAISKFMASPVEVETTPLYAIENYGSAMTPFYSILAIWVGGVVLAAILHTEVEESKNLKDLKPYQCYFGRYFLFMVIGLIQSTIICLGNIYFLEIQCLHPFLFILTGWISSIVFTNLIYTLVISFGDVGKAIAVILMVIQIAGAGGTFPIEVTPEFFQNLYPFLPFTYAINAMRDCVAGIYQHDFLRNIINLLLFIPPSLVIGLLLRVPLINVNKFFEKRLENTHLL